MTSLIHALVAFVAGHPILAALLVFVSALSEAIILIGAIIPGTAIILGVAALGGAAGDLRVTAILTAAAIVGAIAGDGISYWMGHRHGRRITQAWPFRNRPELLERGEAYFASHGGKSVFIARFLPGVRAVVPVAAGMAGMAAGRFYAANIASAVVWGLTHVPPAAGLGTGLSRLGSINPRLLAILVAFAIIAAAAWFVIRLVLWRLIPLLDRVRLILLARVSDHRNPASQFLRRLLANEGGLILPVAFAAISVFALGGFLGIAADVVNQSGLIQADISISNLVQSLRTDPVDYVMVAITMAGDSFVLTALALMLVGWLFAFRQWRVGAAVIVAIGAATLFVPFIKSVIQRARPTTLDYSGAEAFSFPSGHATLSLTILGVLAVILAHHQPIRRRIWIYTGLIVVAAAIALSRIYLGAHWPSDVGAGALFGLAAASAFAFAIHGRRVAIRPGRLSAVLLVVFLAVYSMHVQRSYTTWLAAYDFTPRLIEITRTDWLADGWRRLPERRIALDGGTGEPLTMQSILMRDTLSALLVQSGWSPEGSPALARLISYAAGGSPPLPLYHEGRDAVLTLTKPLADGAGERLVIRVFPSGYAVADSSGGSVAIDLVGFTKERIDPLAFGFKEVEETDPAGNPARDIAEIVRAGPAIVKQTESGGRHAFLLQPAG